MRRVAAERLMLLTVVPLILVRPNVARVLAVLFLFTVFTGFKIFFCVLVDVFACMTVYVLNCMSCCHYGVVKRNNYCTGWAKKVRPQTRRLNFIKC